MLQMMILNANAGVLAGPSATPIAAPRWHGYPGCRGHTCRGRRLHPRGGNSRRGNSGGDPDLVGHPRGSGEPAGKNSGHQSEVLWWPLMLFVPVARLDR